MIEEENILPGDIEAYVLGLCSVAESERIDALRREEPRIDKAILLFEEELEHNFLSQPYPVSVANDERMHKAIDLYTQRHQEHLQVVHSSPKTSSLARIIAIAAGFLLILSAGYNYFLYKQNTDLKTEVTQAQSQETLPVADYNILTKPSITPVAMNGVGIHSICRCTLYWDKKTGKAYLMIHHLMRSSASKSYQLWAYVDGKPVSVGMVDDSIRGRFIELKNVPDSADGFMVTLENKGGANSPDMNEEYLHGKV